ncbi:MAG: TIGR03936 family radical SAM-associated protein [Clostridiaceae bacterium]|nr:TIGR03936 family radical SAM-associated protein [Clostridiaceae bacterium]
MKSARLWFKKDGLAVYISHLDMNRCMTRAVRRAGIPLWYTEGFNPHPYMTFLLPLPLGQEGRREPLDIRIETDMSFAEIKSRLNAVMPCGIEITDVCEPIMKANEIAAAKYEITAVFENEGEAQGFACGAASVIEGGVLNAEKRSKKGIKKVNLCEMIRSFDACAEEKSVKINTVLAAGNTVNLNAELLLSALFAEFAAQPVKTEIVRTGLLTQVLEAFE